MSQTAAVPHDPVHWQRRAEEARVLAEQMRKPADIRGGASSAPDIDAPFARPKRDRPDLANGYSVQAALLGRLRDIGQKVHTLGAIQAPLFPSLPLFVGSRDECKATIIAH
jgi:hypothetical protein